MILSTLVTSQLHFEMCAGLYGHPVLFQLEIDRYVFLGADTDISAIRGPIADISKNFKSCFFVQVVWMREEYNSVLSTPTEADKVDHFGRHRYIDETQISARDIG